MRTITYDQITGMQRDLIRVYKPQFDALRGATGLPLAGETVEYKFLEFINQVILPDVGRLASALGYDAIDVVEEAFIVILNRTATIVQSNVMPVASMF